MLGNVVARREHRDEVDLGDPQILEHQDPDDLEMPDQPHLVVSPVLQLVALHLVLEKNFQNQIHFDHFPSLNCQALTPNP